MKTYRDDQAGPGYEKLPRALKHQSVIRVIENSLVEDLAPDVDPSMVSATLLQGDVTSVATLGVDSGLEGHITAKEGGVLAGLPVAAAVYALLDPQAQFIPLVHDGQRVNHGDVVGMISGPGVAVLAGERVALNFLGRMSGVATLTHTFVDAVAGTKAVILDTRKTAPGMRFLDKYAVRMGGGQNHRMGLYDMILIKDNHIDGAGGIPAAVRRVRQKYGHQYPVEIEVKTLNELETALALEPERIMLDNMPLETIRQAVAMADGNVPLEASGNVSLETVGAIAKTGVDYISVGALTHSAPVFDLSMRLA